MTEHSFKRKPHLNEGVSGIVCTSITPG